MIVPPSLPDHAGKHFRMALPALAILLLGACSTERSLMPTPLVYTGLASRIFRSDVPTTRRQPDIDLLYITDRAPSTGPDDSLPYGEDRARSVAFGAAIVNLGPDLSWTDLVEQSHRSKRTRDIMLKLGRTQELGRFPRELYQVQGNRTSL
jgi:hypothetical protein